MKKKLFIVALVLLTISSFAQNDVCKDKTFVISSCSLRSDFNPFSSVRLELNSKDTVSVLYFTSGYWFVEARDSVGFINMFDLKQTEQMRQCVDRYKMDKLKSSFGEKNAYRIFNHEIWVGMTSEMAAKSIGNPDKINKTVNSTGTHEQWVYRNGYLYFDDGILTTYQN